MKSTLDEFQSPLSREQADLLNRLMDTLQPSQMLWLSGYLAGVQMAARTSLAITPTAAVTATTAPVTAPAISPPAITILVGSQTGNAAKVAETAHAHALAQGLTATVYTMDEYKKQHLKNEKALLVIVSTHGDGDPPDNARAFYDYLHSPHAPRLEQLSFSVLSLGDSSYAHFCKIGKDFDSRLEALGATRLFPRADCDVDYDETAAQWIQGTFAALVARQPAALPMVAAPRATLTAAPAASLNAGSPGGVVPLYSRKNPFPANVLNNINLNGRGAAKETRHIELSIEGSGLHYEPGDALGVIPSNDPDRVEAILNTMKLPGDDPIRLGDETVTLRHALTHTYEITTLTRPFIEKYAQLADVEALKALLADDQTAAFGQFVKGRELLDVIEQYPVQGLTAGDFVSLLRKLPPRLYSIASSQKAYPDEVHITVAVVRYESHGRQRHGVASTYLADGLLDSDVVPIYIEHNKNFKLPTDANAPIIMIGPGTGVAPFRAFLQEREEMGATGKNWLFFGAQHFRTDFLYQIEWLRYRKKGLLTRIDVAFSRDTPQKVYVQHRMQENRHELFKWIEAGAYIYVCGDANNMAPDVHNALLAIVQQESQCTETQAIEYVQNLQREKRYQRDVY